MKRPSPIARIAVIAVLGVLLVGSFVISSQLPSPVEVAKIHCSEKGIPAESLALLGFKGSSGLFANRQTVEFQIKGADPAKRLVVDLTQPVYFLPWQLLSFLEVEQP